MSIFRVPLTVRINRALQAVIRCRIYLSIALLLPLLSPYMLAEADQLQGLKLHSTHLKVKNVETSLSFYRDQLGLEYLGKTSKGTFLQLGEGPQYIQLSLTENNEPAHIASIGLSAKNFTVENLSKQLKELGYKSLVIEDSVGKAPLELAQTYWTDGEVLVLVDQEGVKFQVSASNYCGNDYQEFSCNQENNKNGILSLHEINHFTTFMANAGRANNFYRDLFDLGIQSYQGPTMPTLAVGDGYQFLMFVGGAQAGKPRNPARIHHISLSVDNFDVDGIFNTLKSNGFTARADGDNSTPPFIYYVSKRMPARGGVEGGTPEVYFTDPDGILLQVQDPSYCGGGGYLGEEC